MINNNEPLFIADGMDAPRPELPFIERDAITVILRNPKTGKYLGLRWKKLIGRLLLRVVQKMVKLLKREHEWRYMKKVDIKTFV